MNMPTAHMHQYTKSRYLVVKRLGPTSKEIVFTKPIFDHRVSETYINGIQSTEDAINDYVSTYCSGLNCRRVKSRRLNNRFSGRAVVVKSDTATYEISILRLNPQCAYEGPVNSRYRQLYQKTFRNREAYFRDPSLYTTPDTAHPSAISVFCSHALRTFLLISLVLVTLGTIKVFTTTSNPD